MHIYIVANDGNWDKTCDLIVTCQALPDLASAYLLPHVGFCAQHAVAILDFTSDLEHS